MDELDQQLARAFELDARDLRARGLFDNAQLAEECARACRGGFRNIYRVANFRGLPWQSAPKCYCHEEN